MVVHWHASQLLAVNGSQPATGEDWRTTRLAELGETFPEPVIGASAERVGFRSEHQSTWGKARIGL